MAKKKWCAPRSPQEISEKIEQLRSTLTPEQMAVLMNGASQAPSMISPAEGAKKLRILHAIAFASIEDAVTFEGGHMQLIPEAELSEDAKLAIRYGAIKIKDVTVERNGTRSHSVSAGVDGSAKMKALQILMDCYSLEAPSLSNKGLQRLSDYWAQMSQKDVNKVLTFISRLDKAA